MRPMNTSCIMIKPMLMVRVTVIMMPLTFSVADGIALGFITYVAMKVLTGKHREVSASLYALFVIFVAKFIFL